LEKEKSHLDVQIRGLQRWSGEDLFKFAAGLNLPQNGAAVLYQEYRVESRKLEALADAGMGDAHPQMVAQGARVDVMEKNLQREVTTILEIQQTQLELVGKRLEKIEQVVSRRKDAHVERTLEQGDYIEAKREHEREQQLLQSKKLVHSSQRIMLRIPNPPITVHEEPRVGKNPVAPNVALFLGGGVLGGAVLGFLLALLIGLIGMMRGAKS